jgi:hypothetical protein
MTKTIKELKIKQAKELAALEREIAIHAKLPEIPEGVQMLVYMSELHGISGHVSINAGHFMKKWADKDLILEFVNRFPASIQVVEVHGTFTSLLMKDATRRNYKYEIKSETDVANFWLESSGIPSSWEVDLCWLTPIESEVLKISIALQPQWGFRMSMKTEYSRTGVLTNVSDVRLIVPGEGQRLTKYASGSCTGLNSCRVMFEDTEASLIEYVQKHCK